MKATLAIMFILCGCEAKLPADDVERDSWNKRCTSTCAKHNLKWDRLWVFIDERQFCNCRAYFEVEDTLKAEGEK